MKDASALLCRPSLVNRVELDKDRAMVASIRGNALYSLGRLDEALDAYARARDLHALPHPAALTELDPDRARLAMNEGYALDSVDRSEEALGAYAQARDLHALPHLAERPELDGDRAVLECDTAGALLALSRRIEALGAFVAAAEHWSGQRNLSLPEQERFARCLASMSVLLPEMAVEDPDAARN